MYYGLYWHVHHNKMVELAGSGGIGERLAAILYDKPEGELDARFHFLRLVRFDSGEEWDKLRSLIRNYAEAQRLAVASRAALAVAVEHGLPTSEVYELRAKYESRANNLADEVYAWLDQHPEEMEALHDEQCDHAVDEDRRYIPLEGRWQPH